MKTFCFTIDDNIRFAKEIMQQGLASIFDHPYLAMLRSLHDKFDLKIQLNMFYRMDCFDLSEMSDRYAAQWADASPWLKLSFHSDQENRYPYEHSGYDEVFNDCRAVNDQILRFACQRSLAKTTTVHCCRTTHEGLRALADNGASGLLGLFGTDEAPKTSYSLHEDLASNLRTGQIIRQDGMAFASIDMIVNTVKLDQITPRLTELLSRDCIRVMIHEQYFYEDYKAYQPDFEQKLTTVFTLLCDRGYKSCFFEELICPPKNHRPPLVDKPGRLH